MICRDNGQPLFPHDFTSAGSAHAEMSRSVTGRRKLRKLDVRLMNQTFSLGAINVTGPLARELMARAGVERPPDFLHHKTMPVAGIPMPRVPAQFYRQESFV